VPKRVLILGSTGSIGEQALDVVTGTGALRVVGLSAARNAERIVAQARETGVDAVALGDPQAAELARSRLEGVRVLGGEQGVRDLIAATEPDLVLNAIVGTAGLGPSIATLSAGIDLALANK
jgi:1-deoxy-D-xylulose-5-phosphate reductoisomerase